MVWRFFGPFSLFLFLVVGALGTVLLPDADWRRVWGVALLAALAAWLPAPGWFHRLVRPLRQLREGARRVAAGGAGVKLYPAAGHEVGDLAQSFNALSTRLAGQIAQLEADREQLRTILGGMVEGVIAIDAEQNVRFANDRAADLLDFRASAAVGRRLWEVVRQSRVLELASNALRAEAPTRAELDVRGPGGDRSLDVYLSRLPPGPVGGAVLVLHDTTELRRLERLRQEFVANVSHELKTPLSVIKACNETLLDGGADDPALRTEFLRQIDEQADRLNNLILDLLSLARIESAAQALELLEVPVGEAVRACLERQQLRAEQRRQALTIEAPAEEVIARTDPEALAHVLDNLVDNAVKYTPEGGTITAAWRLDGERAVIEVRDTGIGIPERDLPRVFERFYRVDKARSRELGGTGLGLSIVKHLVQLMRGEVEAASVVGKGSTFRVLLPRGAVEGNRS